MLIDDRTRPACASGLRNEVLRQRRDAIADADVARLYSEDAVGRWCVTRRQSSVSTIVLGPVLADDKALQTVFGANDVSVGQD